ncbi:MAG: metallophosphoesterase family protein [Solirubrobacterales bacterium]|nr:metallophosphoesterase family protein [Solirubrobacterales bacterium]
MALLAVLYDIHGNLPALETVLADARGAGAEQFVLGGDYALFGPFPAETVAALRDVPAVVRIRGNVDRWSAHPDEAPDDPVIQDAITACREALGGDAVAELDRLDEQVVLDGTRYCHASPISDLRSFMPEADADERDLLAGVSERRLVFGHTHLPFRRMSSGGVELINPGSVGMPFDGDPRAAWALIDPGGRVEHRRVAYDNESAARAMTDRFGEAPWAQRSAERLRHARA